MSAMSASPPVGLPLSLITEHKVAASKPPPSVPAATPQAVQAVGAIPAVASTPSAPAVAPQPQTNGMEPAQSPPVPAVAPPTGPPPVPASPPPPQPTVTVNSAPNNAQGLSQVEGGPVAPGSGTSTSGGSGEVEGSSAAVGDVPPAEAQPCVPPTPATVPVAADPVPAAPAPPTPAPPAPQEHPAVVPVLPPSATPPPATPAPAPTPAPTPAPEAPSAPANQLPPPAPAPPVPVPQVLPPAPVEASPPPPSAPAALPPAPSPAPPSSASTAQEKPKPSRSRKRKSAEETTKKSQKVEDPISVLDDGRKSKRARLPTQPYQSPIPELNLIAKMNNTPKSAEEKLIVFYRNEFLAVRNADGGFYVCQAMQNIYRNTPGHRSKIKIRWFSQGTNDVFTPDFYDSTEFDCILTNLNLDRIEKDKYKLPAIEKQRTESILKRAIDAEKGVSQSSDTALTEEHPDGLDLSLYRHEDQLKKRRKKDGHSKKKSKVTKPAEVKKPTRTSARNSSGADDIPIKGKPTKINEKIKSRGSKKWKASKKIEKLAKKKEPEVVTNNKKEVVENSGRKTSNSGAQLARKNSDKTKSAVGAKPGSKAPPGTVKQLVPAAASARQTRQAIPKQ